jgi:RNA polymerase sigma-70 factor, ECF subfamily
MRYRTHPIPDDAAEEIDDTRLILAVQTGDRVALEILYLRYHDRLARFLARFATRREDVEEIVNDTFMTVWIRAKAFRSESLVSTWMIGIAYRTAMRAFRRQKRHSAARWVGILSDQCVDPARDAELKNWLDHALARLPMKHRVAVTLAYQMGFSVEEIATITESSIGTVKSRMFHARLKLRDEALALEGKADMPAS